MIVNRKEIMEELLQNMHKIRHKFWASCASKKELDVTPSQGFVLRFVAENESVNVKMIAEALHVTSSAATQLIDSLVSKGYLVRKENVDDRRVVSISLSDVARKAFKKYKEDNLQNIRELFEVLSDEELAHYAKLNKKIIKGITNNQC